MSRRNALLGLGLLLLGLNLFVWIYLAVRPAGVLTVSFLDVGQGDAILVQSPTGTEVLVDGGRDRSILRELPKRMGPLDRTIDLVVATHPDADHIGGLPGVFSRYKVDAYLEPRIENDTNPTRSLAARVKGEEHMEYLLARRGMRIHLGGGAYADVLFPDRPVDTSETNAGSIILRVVYGSSSFLLTGDAPRAIEEWLVALHGTTLQSDVLKAGHHGSRTSSSETFLAAVNPDFVVISAGENNSYGHPHEEVLARIRVSGAKVLATLGGGAVAFTSDGKQIKER